MSNTITLSLSDEDTQKIIEGVVQRLLPLIEKQPAPLLVDADELARLLSISRPTVDRLRAANVIPSVGEGRLRRYLPDAVIAALQANKKGGDAT